MLSEDFELIEIPSNLIPSSSSCEAQSDALKLVKISVEALDRRVETGLEGKTAKIIKEICDEFLVDGEEVSRMKEEIGGEDFLRVEQTGCTAGIISWKRGIEEIIPKGKSILVQAVDMFSLTTRRSKSLLRRNGTKTNNNNYCPNSCRIEFPLTADSADFTMELAINFRTSVGTFWTRPIQISRKVTVNSNDFSGIFLVTDMEAEDDRLREVRERGGYIFRKIDMKYPITAVVIDAQSEAINDIMNDNNNNNLNTNTDNSSSFDNNTINLLFEAKELNLPIVSSTWLDSLLKNYELPLLS